MKILMVGLGGIGQRHTRNLRAILGDRAEFLAYRVRRQMHVVTPAWAQTPIAMWRKIYSIRIFLSLGAALAEKPDIAFICNPSNLHVPVALACIRADAMSLSKSLLPIRWKARSSWFALQPSANANCDGRLPIAFHPCLRKLAEIVQIRRPRKSAGRPRHHRRISSELASL